MLIRGPIEIAVEFDWIFAVSIFDIILSIDIELLSILILKITTIIAGERLVR